MCLWVTTRQAGYQLVWDGLSWDAPSLFDLVSQLPSDEPWIVHMVAGQGYEDLSRSSQALLSLRLGTGTLLLSWHYIGQSKSQVQLGFKD